MTPNDIKLIVEGLGFVTAACCWDPQAFPMLCTTAWAWRTPPNYSQDLFDTAIANGSTNVSWKHANNRSLLSEWSLCHYL